LRGWNGAADRDNASELQPTGGFAAASVGNQFEMALDRNEIGWDPSIQVAVAARAADVLDEGAVVGLTPGALAIDEFPLTNVVSGATPVLQVKFRALATDIRVDRVSFGLIDGTNRPPDPIDPVPPSRATLPSAMSVPGSGYFYMETRGPILAGSILPERRLPSPPIAGAPPSPPIPLPRRAGMDVMVAY